MLSLAQSQLSLQSEPVQLNSATSLVNLQGNYTDMQTALQASRRRRHYFPWGRVENICVELLLLSEVLNWMPALHGESSP